MTKLLLKKQNLCLASSCWPCNVTPSSHYAPNSITCRTEPAHAHVPAQQCYLLTCMGHRQEGEVGLFLKGFGGIKGQESLALGCCLWNWRSFEQESKRHLLSPWWDKPTLLALATLMGEALLVFSKDKGDSSSPSKEKRRNGNCPSSWYWQTTGTSKNLLVFLIQCINLLEPGNDAHRGSRFALGDSEHLGNHINPSQLPQIKVIQKKRKRGLLRISHGYVHTTSSTISKTKASQSL